MCALGEAAAEVRGSTAYRCTEAGTEAESMVLGPGSAGGQCGQRQTGHTLSGHMLPSAQHWPSPRPPQWRGSHFSPPGHVLILGAGDGGGGEPGGGLGDGGGGMVGGRGGGLGGGGGGWLGGGLGGGGGG